MEIYTTYNMSHIIIMHEDYDEWMHLVKNEMTEYHHINFGSGKDRPNPDNFNCMLQIENEFRHMMVMELFQSGASFFSDEDNNILEISWNIDSTDDDMINRVWNFLEKCGIDLSHGINFYDFLRDDIIVNITAPRDFGIGR